MYSLPQQPADPIQALAALDSVYQHAWERLVWVFTVGGLFIGVVVPFLLQQLQRKRLRVETQGVEAALKKRVEELQQVLHQSIADRLEQARAQLHKELVDELDKNQRALARTAGGLQIVQANAFIESSDFASAAVGYSLAVTYFIEARDMRYVRRSLRSLAECLHPVGRQQLDKLEHGDWLPLLQAQLKSLSERHDRNEFLDELGQAKEALTNALTRE
jgi:uncharacterized membrane-anchored protein YhcB (DUF1043 family)